MVNIRKVKKEESIEVLKIITKVFPKSDISIKENDLVYIAREREQIVGFLHATEETDKILLNGIGIIEEYRGRSIGTKLMKQLTENTKSKPIYLKVKDKNFVAQKLYEKFGFMPKSYGEVYILVKKPEN